MKNTHVLPTDKPSRLTKALHYNNELRLVHKDYQCNPKDEIFQHIYITSDEEIKEGDFYTFEGKFVLKSDGGFKKGLQKIILTTDPDLIKEGVQEIDDEFLEWFVKNPSCEWVELEKFEDGDYVIAGKEYINYSYEIIIPQEELKLLECYFTPSTNTSSSTICRNCGKEKMLHTIGDGIKVSKSVIITKEEPKSSCPKCRTTDLDNCHSIQCPMRKEEPNQKIIASEEDAKVFVEAIKNPPAPNEKLKQAFKNFSKQETIEDPDAYWLSPIKKEREWQEEKLKEIFEHYPNAAPRFQYLNGLIQIALKNITSKKSLETLEEAAERMAKDFPHYSVRENMDDSDIKEWFLEALQKGAKSDAARDYWFKVFKEQFIVSSSGK
jgi:hypothetical protein